MTFGSPIPGDQAPTQPVRSSPVIPSAIVIDGDLARRRWRSSAPRALRSGLGLLNFGARYPKLLAHELAGDRRRRLHRLILRAPRAPQAAERSRRERRRADLRRQPREPARSRRAIASHVFVRADIRDGGDDSRAPAPSRHRRRGELRGREPRRSQHRLGRAVPRHQRGRHAAACWRRRAPPASAGSCRSRPTRSTDRWGRRARSRRRPRSRRAAPTRPARPRPITS